MTLTGGQATFTATATIEVPDDIDSSWENGAITYDGTMYVSQGDTVEADHGVHEVASANVTVTAIGAATWSGLEEGSEVRLGELSDGRVQIVGTLTEDPWYVEHFTEATIDSLIADGFFTAII